MCPSDFSNHIFNCSLGYALSEFIVREYNIFMFHSNKTLHDEHTVSLPHLKEMLCTRKLLKMNENH